jgi:predicted porin
MKKSLLAVAAMTAFAGAAQAQSSVTVYGILDMGYAGYNTRQATGTVVNKTTGNTFTQSAESTSRLGFKGVEDLGGGSSAFFTVELGLTPANSAQAINTGTTQNRQSFVGLKKNGLGDFAFGTQYTPIHNAVSATDPGNTNNMMGNLIYTAGTGSQAPASNENGVSYTIRTNNALTLNSDTFAGFKAHAILIANNQNSNQTTSTVTTPTTTQTIAGGINNQNGWGLGLDYTWNKFYATAALQQLKAQNPITYTVTNNPTTGQTTATFAAGAPVIFGAGQAATLGTNVQDNQYYIAATYDFGILKAYAQYLNRKVSLQEDSGYYLKRNAEQIGVRSYITPTIEAWASGALGKYTAFGYNNPAANLTAWQIGSNYWLSKRTNLYAIYGQVNTSNVSIVNNANPASANANNYAIGVRHTF